MPVAFVRVVRVRRIAVVWVGQVLSATGDQLFGLAVLWVATQRLRGAAGLVAGLGLAVGLVCGLAGGALADRISRRMALVGCDVARALLVLLLPVSALLARSDAPPLGTILLVIVGVQALGTLFNPALQAALPGVAGDERTLYQTNALMESTWRLAPILGPALAGVLLLALPLAHFFTLDALSFGVSALSLTCVGRWLDKPASRAPALPAAPASERAGGPRFQRPGLAAAIRLAAGQPEYAWSVGTLALINLAWSAAFTVGAPLWAAGVAHGGLGTYGLLVGVYGAGNLVSLPLSTLAPRHRMRLMFAGKVLQGAAFVLLAASPGVPLALVACWLAALGGGWGDLTLVTLIQTAFPREHVGKMYGLRAALGSAGLMLGLVLAAPLYALASVPTGIALCGVVMLGAGGAGLARFRRA